MLAIAPYSNLIGYTGVMLVLSMFYYSQTGKLNPRSYLYPVTNLCGAILLLISLHFHPNLPSILIELAWSSISIYGIVRVAIRRKQAMLLESNTVAERSI